VFPTLADIFEKFRWSQTGTSTKSFSGQFPNKMVKKLPVTGGI
jgi:hypothetical protein